MNFNKNFPIAVLDTNIVMHVPNILDILKGCCNIVMPHTLIDELDKNKRGIKKANKNARDFINNINSISEKANLSKDGYKFENDCMLYLDKDNLSHKEVCLDSIMRKEDLKFIAETKNLKETYKDIEVVLLSSDKVLKITASTLDIEVKTLEEFILEYIKDDDKIVILENLNKLKNMYLNDKKDEGNYKTIDNIIFYVKKISNILKSEKNINILYEQAEKYDAKPIYNKIYEILDKDKDIDGLYKLAEKYKPNKMYDRIYEILVENKDIHGLYELIKNHNYKPEREKISEILTEHCNILTDNKDINGLYELAEKYNSIKIYGRIFEILVNNNDIDGLHKLIDNKHIKDMNEKCLPECENLTKIISNKIAELENNK